MKTFLLANSGVRKQINIALCVYLGVISTGYSMSWSAPVTHKLQNPGLSPLSASITDVQMSLVGTLVIVGGFFGPYVVGYLGNRKGRKLCLLIGSLVTIVGQLLLATARNLPMIYVGRCLVGFGISSNEVTAFVYLGEIASTNIRGLLLTAMATFQTVGMVIIYSMGPYVGYSVTAYVGAIIAACNCLGIFFIPETPLYCVLKGNEKKAKEVLNDLGRLDDFQNVLALKNDEQHSNGNDWTEILTIKSNRKAMIITVMLNILQQSSGIIAVVFFATRIFDLVGSTIPPDISTIIIGITQLLSSCIAPVFVERNGRRILLLMSTALSSLNLAVLGVYFYLDCKNDPITEHIRWLPLLTLILFLVAYNIGFAVIPVTLMGELFASNVRSTGSAVSITVGWVFSFALTTAFSSLITTLGGHGTFWIFSGVCALAFFFTVTFVPETKHKSLVEIKEMLSK